MKKLLIVVCFLSIFIVCGAPNFAGEQAKYMREISNYNFYLNEYDREFTQFANQLGFKESGNNWKAINSLGYFGEFQFGNSTLKRLGYGHITLNDFKNNPSVFPKEVQIEALKTLIMFNELDLNRKISKFSDERYSDYIGKTINGVYISKGGLLAGMHLGGLGGIKTFLITNGKVDKDDDYGTKVSDYLREFSMYDLSKDYIEYKITSNFDN